MTPRFLSLSIVTALAAFSACNPASARGVSPYLPLNLDPEIERLVERVLILGDKPVKRRPIPAAVVLEALPKACAIDQALCDRVTNYLRRYMGDAAITHLTGGFSLGTGDSRQVVPNRHGLPGDSPWYISAGVVREINDYVYANLGGVAFKGRAIPTGTYLSLGFSFAQLDVGYRDHWFSPLSDSSTLISTEAPTMPSVTLSNYEPLTRFGLSYEIFLAEMSRQENIAYFNTTTSGRPRLAGIQVATEPANGYALAINRIFQYGGGARTAGASQFIDALFSNTNSNDSVNGNSEFGNQAASITSSITFPGAVPFAVRLEYAGDDNAYAGPYRLGVTNMSLGLDFPKLWSRYDLSFEVSEWQQVWYQHHIYPYGLTNKGVVIGHWFGESKVFSDRVFGDSQSVALGVELPRGYLRARYRTLANADYSPYDYDRQHDLTLSYAASVKGHRINAELAWGHDVFGESYSRLGISMDLLSERESIYSRESESEDSERVTEYFVDSGVNYSQAFERLVWFVRPEWTEERAGYHIGVGARRKVGERHDLGVRLEADNINSRQMLSLRALDYRFRYNRHVAANAFFGFSRYDIYSLPAYGYYFGGGLQWTNVFDKFDLSLDYRLNDKLTRTKVLTTDYYYGHVGGIYVDTRGTALYLSYRF